jgi:PIN domain nuclease of toxin-antitoxin system
VIVLDTHALLWVAGSSGQLSARASETIGADSERVLSTASVQEIAYLVARGRVTLDRPLRRWLGDVLIVHEVRVLPPTVQIAIRAGSLDPVNFHGDPADRLIYATAVEYDARIVTADRKLRDADPERAIW